jgi:acetyl-CoA synthetase
VVHACGGYLVGVTYLARAFLQLGERDIYYCTSDLGWAVGHSYIVYGPLAVGATVLFREGAPDWPSADVTWELVERFGVDVMFTAPTAVRMWMSHGAEAPGRFDLSRLRLLACAGEPLNPEAHRWAQRHLVGQGDGFVVDNWWQTEVAAPVLGTLPAFEARPGRVGKPMPGARSRWSTPRGGRSRRARAGCSPSPSRCPTCCARCGTTPIATPRTGARSPACTWPATWR